MKRDKRHKHGEARKTPEYTAWEAMKRRCLNPNQPYYAHYGGRGITVCKEWQKDFTAFLSHVGRKPSSRHSLDRIDNNGNYVPGNVHWVLPREQNRNSRRNVLLTHDGETHCVTEWEIRLGFTPGLIFNRIRRGVAYADLLAPPVRQVRKVGS